MTAALITAATIAAIAIAAAAIRSSQTRRNTEATPLLHAARAQEQINFYRTANRRLADENDRRAADLRQLKAGRASLPEQAKLPVRRYPRRDDA